MENRQVHSLPNSVVNKIRPRRDDSSREGRNPCDDELETSASFRWVRPRHAPRKENKENQREFLRMEAVQNVVSVFSNLINQGFGDVICYQSRQHMSN